MKPYSGLIALSLCTCPPLTALADDEPASITIHRLGLETGMEIAHAAVNACRDKGIQVTAVVVDRDGNPQVVLRDTLAPLVSVEIARQKAYTAANFMVATSKLGNRADTPVGRVEGLVMTSGGIPIQVAGQMLGAVGVSGAPSGTSDESCAREGVSRVTERLEFEM